LLFIIVNAAVKCRTSGQFFQVTQCKYLVSMPGLTSHSTVNIVMRLFLDEFYASIIRSVQIKESPVFVIE